jgi:hypothetical protein
LPAGNREVGEDHAAGTSHDGPPGRKELAMTGSEQGPTEDVEGHGPRLPEDETTGDDRGIRQPDTEAVDDTGFRPPDDTEGHGYRYGQDTEADDEGLGGRLPEDTEGHAYRRPSQDPGVGFPDDTEGHIYRRPSQDPEAVDEDQAGDDVEGHRRY